MKIQQLSNFNTNRNSISFKSDKDWKKYYELKQEAEFKNAKFHTLEQVSMTGTIGFGLYSLMSDIKKQSVSKWKLATFTSLCLITLASQIYNAINIHKYIKDHVSN